MPEMTPASASLIPHGDCYGHGSRTGSGYKEVYGDYRYDKPVPDIGGEGIMEYTLTNDLLLCNIYLKKCNSHHITDRFGNTACVISRGPVTDVMVISGEEVALQPSAGKRHVD